MTNEAAERLRDKLWADMLLDACASDGPIRDADVRQAMDRGREKIESAEPLAPILSNLFDPENAGAGHGKWMPGNLTSDFWLVDDDGCSLLVSAADAAALINHFLAVLPEQPK